MQRGRNNAGFTIVELLAAMLVLAILGTLISSAMVTGLRVMESSEAVSNAQVLRSSVDAELADVLRYAQVRVPGGAGEVIVDPSFDSDSYLDASGQPVRMGALALNNGYLALVTDGGASSIPKAAGIYTDFQITQLSVIYTPATDLFEGVYTIESKQGSYICDCEFAVRSLVGEVAAP